MSNLDKAIVIATNAHAGQLDKAGQPYILHPLRLMFRFQAEVERIVAVMHDVVEDSEVTLDDLRSFRFSEQIIEAIDYLTKKEGETYTDFITRVSSNDIASKIKAEDIKDNLDLTRLDKIGEKDLARIKKYHSALAYLTSRDY